MISNVNYYALVSLMGISCLVGCGKSVDANSLLSSEGPLTVSELKALKEGVSSVSDALPLIRCCNEAVREAMTTGNPEKSHRPLDTLDAVFIHLSRVIKSESLTEPQKETAEDARKRLFLLFSSFHAQYDRGEEPDYLSIAEEAQSLIASLESVLPESERALTTDPEI